MNDPKQLPYMIKLLEDESPEIRQEILKRLDEFGPGLEPALDQLPEPPGPDLLAHLQPILERHAIQEAEPLRMLVPNRLFVPGQLVRHRRYGYRGVIVNFDLSCQADEQWYASNQTQPDPNQPWYHVLVDGTDQVTYAAESSLAKDLVNDPVRHPLTAMYFAGFDHGKYIRNSRPWPHA